MNFPLYAAEAETSQGSRLEDAIHRAELAVTRADMIADMLKSKADQVFGHEPVPGRPAGATKPAEAPGRLEHLDLRLRLLNERLDEVEEHARRFNRL